MAFLRSYTQVLSHMKHEEESVGNGGQEDSPFCEKCETSTWSVISMVLNKLEYHQ